MASRRTHDVVATVGKYKDGNGDEKKRYLNVGSAFTGDDGRISLRLDAMPVTPEWSGWLSLYPIKDEEPRRSPPQQRTNPQEARRVNNAHRQPPVEHESHSDGMEDDDIPF